MENYKPKSKAWFTKRIGKRIFRDETSCPCDHCKKVYENGLMIYDEQHADYLAAIDADYAAEGHYMNYRDNKGNMKKQLTPEI